MILRDVKYTRYGGGSRDIDRLSKKLGLPEGKALETQEYDSPAVKGPRGVLLAIIGQAYLDALRGDSEALAYFDGDLYRHHLTLLEINPEWLPNGLIRHETEKEPEYV